MQLIWDDCWQVHIRLPKQGPQPQGRALSLPRAEGPHCGEVDSEPWAGDTGTNGAVTGGQRRQASDGQYTRHPAGLLLPAAALPGGSLGATPGRLKDSQTATLGPPQNTHPGRPPRDNTRAPSTHQVCSFPPAF